MITSRYVISDLHMAEGTFRGNSYLGTENFTIDLEFQDFINGLLEIGGVKELIINGDFVDFIRITEYPRSKAELDIWQIECQKAIPTKQINADCISCRERRYGLKTNDYKIIWKLYMAIEGHKLFFIALAKWMAAGNYLTIIEGNHDPEWYWPKVQEYFGIKLKELNDAVEVKRLKFYIQDGGRLGFYDPHPGVRIIHGHHLDPMTAFEKDRVLSKDENQLTLPSGSFVNRYIINAVELEYPFIDNLRPMGKTIMSVVSKNYVNAFQLLFLYTPYLGKMLYRFHRIFILKILKVVLAIFLVGLSIYLLISNFFSADPAFGIENKLLGFVLGLIPVSIVGLFNSFKSILGFKNTSFQDKLFNYAKENGLHTIIAGHNHDPESLDKDGVLYYNSGSWTLTYLLDAGTFRRNYLLTFVKINDKGECELKKWNQHKDRIENYAAFRIKRMIE